jgi:hypothetical protein
MDRSTKLKHAAEVKRRSRTKRIAAGLCPRCGKPANGHHNCETCRGKVERRRKQRRQERASAGRCRYCENKALPNQTRCKTHITKHRIDCNTSNRKLKELVINHYGGCCSCPNCPERHNHNLKFLTIDHVNGNGTKHRQQFKSSSGFYAWLKNNHFPPEYQTLCWNCNAARHLNGGVCPHQER